MFLLESQQILSVITPVYSLCDMMIHWEPEPVAHYSVCSRKSNTGVYKFLLNTSSAFCSTLFYGQDDWLTESHVCASLYFAYPQQVEVCIQSALQHFPLCHRPELLSKTVQQKEINEYTFILSTNMNMVCCLYLNTSHITQSRTTININEL